jgi:hypothetical protein
MVILMIGVWAPNMLLAAPLDAQLRQNVVLTAFYRVADGGRRHER